MDIRERFINRFGPLASTISILLSYDYDEFWVAGSSLLRPIPNDYDIYAYNGFDFAAIKERAKSFEHVHILWESKNALTLNINGTKVQFCNYKKRSLQELIESFDFAHVQIGIAVEICWMPGEPEDGGGYDGNHYGKIQTSLAWHDAMIEQESKYTHSEYPLSSLLRVHKYRQRDWLSANQSKTCILQTLTDVLQRGYKDYKDFKDQLLAVDLRLLEPEQSEAAWNLWLTCCDIGLVKHTSHIERDEFMEDWDE